MPTQLQNLAAQLMQQFQLTGDRIALGRLRGMAETLEALGYDEGARTIREALGVGAR